MKNLYYITAILALYLSSGTAVGADDFSPPELKKEISVNYPRERKADASETSVDDGLVEIIFMVDAKGATFAPTVLRASLEKFIEPSLRALDKHEYQPALHNGKPVAAAMSKTFSFEYSAADSRSIRGSSASFTNVRDRGVPDGYQSFYDEFTRELQKEAPDRTLLESLLQRMVQLKHQSFYSLAYHSLARFRFAELFQGANEKIAALRDLVWYDPYIKEKYRILQGDLEDVVWTNLLKLEIESGQYAEAMKTHARVSQENASLARPFDQYIVQIAGLRNSDQFTQRPVSIDDGENVVVPLLKHSFTFTEVEGQINALEVYCDRRHAELQYQPDAQFELPAAWGECALKIIAAPGTRGKMLEQ